MTYGLRSLWNFTAEVNILVSGFDFLTDLVFPATAAGALSGAEYQ